MDTRSDFPSDQMTTDQRINAAIRQAVEQQGTTRTELGRRLGYPHSSWARKMADGPMHQRYSVDEVVRIAAALGLTVNDLVYGRPVFSNED